MTDSRSAETQGPDSSTPGRPVGGFRAHLQGVGLHDLVMLQNLVRASGVFVVLSGDRSGSLHFARGHLFHAETPDMTGDAAALAILSWREGEFINSDRVSAENPTVTSSLEALLVKLAQDADDARPSEPPLTTATGIRRRMDGVPEFKTTTQGLGLGAPVSVAAGASRGIAAAATPGIAAQAPRLSTRAGEMRGVTHVLVSPQGALIDGSGVDADALASRVAYVTRLVELIGQAMGSGDARSLKVRGAQTELLVRRHPDGHVSGSLGPAESGNDAAPPSSPPPSSPPPLPPPFKSSRTP